MERHVGKLDWFWELGIDGVFWVLEEDGKTEMDGVRLVDRGDHLKIYREDGAVIFDDVIVPDYKVGKVEHPMIKGLKVQFALGCWVCWIQQGWQPDTWAALFIKEKEDQRLRAELTKKEGV